MAKEPEPRAISWVQWIALFGTITGARLWMIAAYGTSLPINDQWSGEGAVLFKPWVEGTLRIGTLFSPHNEHRIVLSRLLSLGLLQLNGQWDSLLEMTVNALFCGLIGVAVASALWHLFNKRYRFFVLITVTLWLALPYAHENTLWGFQSSFYFLLFFSLLGIWGLGLYRAFAAHWSVGVIGAALACLSMGSGFFAATAVLGLVTLRLIKQRRYFRESIATILVASTIILISLHFRDPYPPHDFLKTVSVHAWLIFFGRCLAWPFCQSATVAILMYLPLGLLAFVYLWRNVDALEPKLMRLSELLLGTGLWVILQCAAIAYSRGGDGHGAIASRYMDMLALGAVVNVCALVVVISQARWANRWRKWGRLAAALWAIALVIGAGLMSYRELASQYGRQGYLRAAEQHVRAYLATGDRALLAGNPAPVPYPNAAVLAGILDDPAIRGILPAAVRLPLPINKSTASNEAFVENGYPSYVTNPSRERVWGSYSAGGATARGSMETLSIRPRLPYLELELAGYLRQGATLILQDDRSAKAVRFIPTRQVEPYWRSGRMAVPGESVRLVARDESAEDWFAFREPRELGRFSLYAEWLVRKGRFLFFLGLALWFVILLQSVLLRIRNSRSTKPVPSHK